MTGKDSKTIYCRRDIAETIYFEKSREKKTKTDLINFDERIKSKEKIFLSYYFES